MSAGQNPLSWQLKSGYGASPRHAFLGPMRFSCGRKGAEAARKPWRKQAQKHVRAEGRGRDAEDQPEAISFARARSRRKAAAAATCART